MSPTARPEPERLQKVLARAGLGSRRYCEELIRQGRVAVGGQIVTEMGTKVLPGADLTVDGRPVGRPEPQVYLIVNKPVGYVSTVRDPQGRPTVLDLVRTDRRMYPVGRLDYDSEGLLLLTNDGELAHALMHPGHEVEREYEILVEGNVTDAVLSQLRRGVDIEGRLTARANVAVIKRGDGGIWLRFVVHEGRKRQIRRMCEAVGLVVRKLLRTRMGPIILGGLRPGDSRPLRSDELGALRRLTRRRPTVSAAGSRKSRR